MTAQALPLSCKTVHILSLFIPHSTYAPLPNRNSHRVLRNVLTNYILTIEVNPISRRKIIIKNHILLLSFSSTVTPFYWYELHFNIKRVSFLYKLEIQTYWKRLRIHTANIDSLVTSIGCIMFASVLWLSCPTTVYTTINDSVEYSFLL